MKIIPKISCYIYLLLCFWSCNISNVDKDTNEQYLVQQFKIAKALFKKNDKLGTKYIDSVYNASFNLSKLDFYNKYVFKSSNLLLMWAKENQSLIAIDSAIDLLKDDFKTYPNEIISAYNLKGNILINQNKFDEAFKYFFLAKTLAEKLNNKKQIAISNISLGNVQFKQENFDDAKNYFQRALVFLQTKKAIIMKKYF